MSLGTVLIVPFVVQIFAAVGIVGYLSFKNGQKAVNNLAYQLMEEVSDRLENHVHEYLETPQLINQINLDAIRQGYLNLDTPIDKRLSTQHYLGCGQK